MKFRKKPVVIEAIQWNAPKDGKISLARECTDHLMVRPTDYMEVFNMLGTSGCSPSEPYWSWEVLGVIDTLEGKHIVTPGDWIIKGVSGEFYPCKPEIFAATYEAVE